MTRRLARLAGISRVILLVGFFALVGAPLTGWLLGVKPREDMPDMQELAAWPDWPATPLAQWPGEFEAWLNDHFSLRDQIIRWHAVIWNRWLGAPSGSVVVGRKGWLFFVGEHTMEDYRGQKALSQVELARWRSVLAGRAAWLRDRHIAYLVVFVPDKPAIYPEFLPGWLQTPRRPGRLDQLSAALSDQPWVHVLDLRPAFLHAKSREILYWPWDSHWNGFAQAEATRAVVRELQDLGVPAGALDGENRFHVSDEVRPSFDCIELLGLRGSWPTTPVPVIRIDHPADLRRLPFNLRADHSRPDDFSWRRVIVTERTLARGRAVMFCDSFFRFGGLPVGHADELPLSLEFRRLVNIWEYDKFETLADIVESEHPDVVIDELAERKLDVLPQDNPAWQSAATP